jgi:hypothetical protein
MAGGHRAIASGHRRPLGRSRLDKGDDVYHKAEKERRKNEPPM